MRTRQRPRRPRPATLSVSVGPLLALLLVVGVSRAAESGPPRRVAQNPSTLTLPAPGGGLPTPNTESLSAPPAAPLAPVLTIPLAPIDGQDAIEISSEDGLVSLVVRDAPLRHVMSLLASSNQLSLVFASATDVPVTATLDRVPLEQAIDSLLMAHGFTWALRDRVIHVTSIAAASTLPAGVQGRRVAVLELDFASAADLDPGVKGMLSPVGNSWVLETNNADNRRTKEAIVVEDIEANLRRIERFVSEADQPPRQVLIEVHLLEVELDRQHRAGVNLNALARLSGTRIAAGSAGLARNAVAGSLFDAANTPQVTSPSFFVENVGGDLGLLLEALIATTDAKTLANPRVLAVNGQQARIQIGEQLGFRVTTTTETSTLESVEFLDVGVVLSVTPRITRDGRVLMRIKPEVSSGLVSATTGLPEEETTELETDVLLADGQGMVIGGLIQERDDAVVSRVPVLSKIPYAGFLFQRKEEVKRRTELVVALRPQVLPYNPVQQQRNDDGVFRAEEPLIYGPLCRNPRPYEPRLPSTLSDDNRPKICCEEDPCHPAAHQPIGVPCAAAPRPTIRRLPPVDAPARLSRRPATRLIY